jgi:hypothetical protein
MNLKAAGLSNELKAAGLPHLTNFGNSIFQGDFLSFQHVPRGGMSNKAT